MKIRNAFSFAYLHIHKSAHHRFYLIIFFALFFTSCAKTQDRNYTGSTPADAHVVREFLNIPAGDSVDFIRWKLALQKNSYTLLCNYGIGKPNTNGFIDGGKKVSLGGSLKKEKNYYSLSSDNKILKLIELNANLLHLLDDDNSLLVGGSGWSYTITNSKPSISDKFSIVSKQTPLADSMVFGGRTPCGIPGILEPGKPCYKLKLALVLYANAKKDGPGSYKLRGTPWRDVDSKRGTWIITEKNGRVTYQLNDDKGNGYMYLLKTDENILLITDAQGNLLTGDEDFSYTLNRRRRR